MDHELKAFLDTQDWETLVKRLTLAALYQMKRCGWSNAVDNAKQNPMATMAEEYAVDAMVKAYEGCSGKENHYDRNRGEFYPWIEHLVRRLITDDAKKRKIRARWPLVPLEDEDDVSPELEEASEYALIDLVSGAEDDLAAFISAAVAQLEDNPDWAKPHWGHLQTELGITRHQCDQLRKRLEQHLERCLSQLVR